MLAEAYHCGSLKMFAKALLQKVFGGDNVGVGAEGVNETPHADMFTEASCFSFAKGVG